MHHHIECNWLIHGTKNQKDSQLQSLKYLSKLPLGENVNLAQGRFLVTNQINYLEGMCDEKNAPGRLKNIEIVKYIPYQQYGVQCVYIMHDMPHINNSKYHLCDAFETPILYTILSDIVSTLLSILIDPKVSNDKIHLDLSMCIDNYIHIISSDEIYTLADNSSPPTTRCIYVSHIFPWNTIERPFCAVYCTQRTTSGLVETFDSTSWYICFYIKCGNCTIKNSQCIFGAELLWHFMVRLGQIGDHDLDELIVPIPLGVTIEPSLVMSCIILGNFDIHCPAYFNKMVVDVLVLNIHHANRNCLNSAATVVLYE